MKCADGAVDVFAVVIATHCSEGEFKDTNGYVVTQVLQQDLDTERSEQVN